MEKSFYTGKGIGVCILDTGIYEHIDFTGRIWAFYDFLDFKRRPYDDNGHGTHVAGAGGRRWHCFHGKIQRRSTWLRNHCSESA